MRPDCRYWRDIDHPNAGECVEGHYGGRPSHGICKQCPHRDPHGWGDVLAVLFWPFKPIAKLVARLRGKKSCGCDERRRKLNRAAPYNRR